MVFNFDEVVDRRGTNSMKWDTGPRFMGKLGTERFDEDTISVYTADMDFRCPPSVKEEIMKVVEHNIYGYTMLCPEVDMRYFDAVINWCKRRYDWEIGAHDIFYVNGTLEAIRVGILAFSNPGDGVLLNRPIYTPFARVIQGTGRQLVNSQLVNTDGYYTVDFEDFEAKAALETTKIFLLCHPHNPTGRVWTDEELMRMYEICQKHGVTIISDEIHADLTRKDVPFHPIAKVTGGKGIMTCTGVNKSFNVAGLEASNVIVTDPEMKRKVAFRLGMKMPSPVTVAAIIGAYNGGDEWLDQLRDYIDGTFDWVLDFCKKNLPKMKCVRPEGTYIFWMDFRDYGLSAEEIHKRIYVDANVLLEGGKMFDPDLGDGFERICLSTRRALIQEAFERIAAQFQ